MFSISTVASSTRMPTASARPPSVMMLIVSPSALSTMIDDKDRQRDRDRDDQRAAPAAEEEQDHERRSGTRRSTASRTTPLIDARTNTDWSPSGVIVERSAAGSAAICGSVALTRAMMSSVEALPVFRIGQQRRRAGRSTRTMLVCGG